MSKEFHVGLDATIGVRLSESLSPEQIESLQYDIREAMGVPDLRVFNAISSGDTERHFNEFGEGVPGVLIDNPWRYYGTGYERGPWSRIGAVIRWLRVRFPAGEVCYSSDASETCLPFSEEQEAAMWKHWAENGGQPYRRGWTSLGETINHSCCGKQIVTNGGGAGRLYGYCLACQQSFVQENGIVTAQSPHNPTPASA